MLGYPISEIARETGISEPTIRLWCQKGKVKGAWKQGRGWRIPSVYSLPSVQAVGKRAPAYPKLTPLTD